MAKATAAKPKDDDKKPTTAATATTEGAGPATTDKADPAAQSSAPAAGDTSAAPAEPVRLPGVVVTGLQLCEALTFLAPDGSREQLGESLILELMEPAGRPAGLYAYHVECPEEGAILLTGEGVELVDKAESAAPVAADESAAQSPSARAADPAPNSAASQAEASPILVVDSLSTAFMDVLAERRRQQGEKGYSAESDDALTDYQLPRAAACYVLASAGVARHKSTLYWPFAGQMKPSDSRRRNLVKAGALILAELERLDRDAEQG